MRRPVPRPLRLRVARRASPVAERGSAMLVAIGAMLVMSILAALAVQAAVAGSDGSNADSRGKQAVQAAEAGLRTATYRLSMLLPVPAKCIVVGVADPSGGSCAPSPEASLGNGSSFSYRTTPALTASDTCAGLPVRTHAALTQRCITATGTTDGVARRLQVRVAAYASTPLFPVPGILGLDGVELSGNFDVRNSTVATNGTLSANGNGRIGAAALGPRGTISTSGNTSVGTQLPRRAEAEGDFVLGPVDPGTSATVNDNGRIERGLRKPPVGDYDSVSSKSSNVTYDPDTRSLRASGNTTLNLGGKVYNFCSISITGNLTLVIAPGAKVAIYVDSPDNPNSGCPPGSGGVAVGGNFDSGSASSDPTDLQLYVVGTADGAGTVSVNGNSTLTASIYAPRSTFVVTGNSSGKGAIAARSVTMRGNAFQYDERSGSLQTGSIGTYYRTAWRECPSRAPAESPGSC